MKTKSTKEMIFEVERVRVVCRSAREITDYCRECRTEANFVSVAEAARTIQTNMQTVFRLTDAKILHSFSAANGKFYVCFASLLNFYENRFR